MLNALFVPTGNSGINYWRMWNFYNAAYRNGHMNAPVIWNNWNLYEVHSWERDVHKDYENFFRITKQAQDWAIQADIIVFGMLHGSGISVLSENSDAEEDYLNRSLALFLAMKDMFPNKPILMEIDDDMLSTPPYNPAASFYAPQSTLRKLTIKQMSLADGLIVSTPTLGQLYSEFQPNYHVIPNSIDFKAWDKARNAKRKARNGIRIGWAGGANHEDDLKIMEKVVPIITSKFRNVSFTFVHGCPHYLRNLPKVHYKAPWTSIDKYPRMLAGQDFDIGIAPLVDNSFNRGKSNLRWLEYSALGIPTVASRVGHFKETIRDGEDGFLATGLDEWIEKISILIQDRAKRKQMGLVANDRIRKDFNVDVVSKTYADILQAEVDVRRAHPIETEGIPA